MASLSLEPRQGIRLDLAQCSKIRSYQGGGDFWELQNQQVIRQTLGDFLPRAEENGGGVLFQHFVGGREVCSESIGTGGSGAATVPHAELTRLQSAVQALKEKENDPLTDANAKKLIAAFRLPDPAKDPEFYRLYGPKWNRKLLVLWGVEKEPGSALIPTTALSRIRPPAKASGWLNLWPWLLGLLGLLIVTWVAWDWMSKRSQDRSSVARSDGAEVGPSPLAGGSSGSRRDVGVAPPEERREKLAPSDALSDGEPQRPSLPNAATPSEPGSASSGLTPSMKANPTSSETQRSSVPMDSPAKGVPNNVGTPSGPSASPQPLASPSGQTPPNSSPLASSAGAQPSTPPPLGQRADSPPGSQPPRASSQPTQAPPATDKSSGTPRPGSSRRPSPNPSVDEPSDTPPAPQKPTTAGQSTPPAPQKPTTADQSTPPAPQTSTTADRSTSPAPSPMAPTGRIAPAASGNSTAAHATPSGPTALEITNTRTAGTPRNGKVEVLLNAIARDASGNLVPLTQVTGWQIDGKPQTLNGQPLTTTSLPLQLSKGAHRVGVSGKGANGQPLRAEADVDVDIQVQQSGNVQIKPRPRDAGAR